MNPNNSSATSSKSLNAYLLSAGALTTMAATSTAAIVPIAIGSGPGEFDIGGINGGVSSGNAAEIDDFPFTGGGTLGLHYNTDVFNYLGLGVIASSTPGELVQFAATGYVNPTIFSSEQLIDDGSTFTGNGYHVAFFSDFMGPISDLGAGNYMGFKTITGNYGWLEVTWDGTAKEFQILSGAYESDVGVAIPAGVPEPSAIALLVGGAAGLIALRRRRQQKNS